MVAACASAGLFDGTVKAFQVLVVGQFGKEFTTADTEDTEVTQRV
jgi:hypothetical protein